MRKRFQKGSLQKKDGRWVAQWWDQGRRPKRVLGTVTELTKSEAERQLAALLVPINARFSCPSARVKFGDFVNHTYRPCYQRKWKKSTAVTNNERMQCYLLPAFGQEPLEKLTREVLQQFLDDKAAAGLSFSTVAHLRWDLRQILRMAEVEGYIERNTAEMLFVPSGARRGESRVMTKEEVNQCIRTMDRRERLVVQLAILSGLRPGEIFALRCGSIRDEAANIIERVYRNELDTPKTRQSVRDAAVPQPLFNELLSWIEELPINHPEAWLFPSENFNKPLSKDNVWRRHIQPKLDAIGLGWANFHVFRRTHATHMNQNGAHPKVIADNMGHSVDVNQNVYTRTPLEVRREAVNSLAAKLRESS
jgi:integrase